MQRHEKPMLCFGAKAGYKAMYERVLRNPNTHISTRMFRDSVGRQPDIVQSARSCTGSVLIPQEPWPRDTLKEPPKPDMAAGDWVISMSVLDLKTGLQSCMKLENSGQTDQAGTLL